MNPLQHADLWTNARSYEPFMGAGDVPQVNRRGIYVGKINSFIRSVLSVG
jgi:hypothetical protein